MDPDFVNKYNQVLSRLKLIENFDGSDPGKLPQFLQKIEQLMPAINAFDDYYKAQLLGHIKNKCTDRARDAVFTRQLSAPAGSGNGHASGAVKAESWHRLKEQLLHSFAERESSYSLIHKIRSAVLDSNIELYYQKMAKLKQRLLNRKLTHNDTLYSLEDIERITLQVFRDHLPEPTHSMILRRNPKSMEEAYRYIVEVQQQFYTQNGPLGGELGATFSTSHKQTFGGGGVGIGASTMGSGVGMGLGIASVGLASTGFSYNRQLSEKGVAGSSQGYNQLSSNKSYYNQSAPLVGAGKTSPMFKSNGNPSFKSSFSYNGSSSSSMDSWSGSKSKDAKGGYQQGKAVNGKAKSGSGWRK
ncbi:keratin, type II cytoskeletal 1 [Drosophila mojavensis]|uniref:keratin, type II cytoskeletal 1 n=1 Tax=Drosophila mojavensis TaxID=7230 RepID=UPI001CD17108|nr:keratin, type II cytoskeletal 1 [Drosophila mojavensis]